MAKLIGKGTSADFATFAEAGILNGNYNQRAFEYLKLSGGSGRSFNLISKQASILGVSLGPEPIDPSTLFASGERGAWYDPSDLSTMFQEPDATVPVTADGDKVLYMVDKSGNGFDLRENNTTDAPTYRTDGTYHWLEGNGTNTTITTVSGTVVDPVLGAQGFMAAAWEGEDDTERSTVISDGNNFTTDTRVNLYSDCRPTGELIAKVEYTQNLISRLSPSRNTFTPYVTDVNKSSANSTVTGYVNGVAGSVESFTPPEDPTGESGSHEITLFSEKRFPNYFKGKIFGAIVLDRELDQTERQGVEAYLGEKSGATLTF